MVYAENHHIRATLVMIFGQYEEEKKSFPLSRSMHKKQQINNIQIKYNLTRVS
jgi:hypothetical protein